MASAPILLDAFQQALQSRRQRAALGAQRDATEMADARQREALNAQTVDNALDRMRSVYGMGQQRQNLIAQLNASADQNAAERTAALQRTGMAERGAAARHAEEMAGRTAELGERARGAQAREGLEKDELRERTRQFDKQQANLFRPKPPTKHIQEVIGGGDGSGASQLQRRFDTLQRSIASTSAKIVQLEGNRSRALTQIQGTWDDEAKKVVMNDLQRVEAEIATLKRHRDEVLLPEFSTINQLMGGAPLVFQSPPSGGTSDAPQPEPMVRALGGQPPPAGPMIPQPPDWTKLQERKVGR